MLADKTIPVTANNYYRVLAQDEPVDDVEEPANKKSINISIGIEFMGYGESVKDMKANIITAVS